MFYFTLAGGAAGSPPGVVYKYSGTSTGIDKSHPRVMEVIIVIMFYKASEISTIRSDTIPYILYGTHSLNVPYVQKTGNLRHQISKISSR